MDLSRALNPNGGVTVQRSGETPALDADLLDRVLAPENLREAWKQVKANRGAAGVDGMTLADFPAFARNHWPDIRQALREGRYQPAPVRRKEIPKSDGGWRMLGIPTVTDRVIQQAIARALTPIFDPTFSESSYGYRPGRCAHGAVKQVRALIRSGYKIVVDMDLSKFFDEVNHDILMCRVARRVRDKRLLRLMGKYLRAGVDVEGEVQPTAKGVPQGGPLSPLLANIVLDDLDRELEKRRHRFARYADDLVILVRSRRAGERVMESITRFITRKLKLVVNERKSAVIPAVRCAFLGFTFKRNRISWTREVEAEFKRRVRLLTGRSWGVSMEHRLGKLSCYLRGWMNYYGLSEQYRPIPELDGWIRRRVRMCYWKQWRNKNTRIRSLIRLGTTRYQAILTGLSRKGYWHLSKTLATQTGMTNQWLKDQGLVSLKERWVAFHYSS